MIIDECNEAILAKTVEIKSSGEKRLKELDIAYQDDVESMYVLVGLAIGFIGLALGEEEKYR